MQRLFSFIFLMIGQLSVCSQTNIAGVINEYTTISTINFCESIIGVDDASNFQIGEAVLIIQMNGATINESNTAGFGTITNLSSAGLFERSTITAINNNEITLGTWLINDYALDATLQLVNIPSYETAIVTDTLKAKPWNGTTGGVLAFDVQSSLEINAPIDASGQGFRGGISETVNDNNCTWLINQNDYGYEADNWRGALKGEGVAAASANNVAGRGAQANGGGGGNDHNSGGGGGGHIGAGGIGGENEEPSTFGCDGNFPGLGGRSLNMDSGNRIYMGGGGGAGHSNNGVGSNGGDGGGIIMIQAETITGTNAFINAKGTGSIVNDGQDGGGGGGAGGTIWLQVGDITSDLILNVDGFAGSQVDNQNGDRCFGPGGGGAGGAIYTNLLDANALLSASVSGGVAGVTINTTSPCNGSSLGAQAGQNGIATSDMILPIGEGPVTGTLINEQPEANTYCVGDMAFFDIVASGLSTTYQWELNDGTGFAPIPEDAPYSGTQSNMLAIDNIDPTFNGDLIRCVVNSTCGNELISSSVTITVESPPTAAFSFTVSDLSVTFDNLSTSSGNYNWDFGDNNTSNETDPVHTYAGPGMYIVNLMLGNDCGVGVFTDTINLGELPTPDFSLDMNGGCAPHTVQFTDETMGFVGSWSWSFPGGTPANSAAQNPTVTYNEPGIYDVVLGVTNNTGSISVTYTDIVEILSEPIANFEVEGNGLMTIFTNVSEFADTYQWDFGDGSAISILENPVHTFDSPGAYTVQLTASNEYCSADTNISIQVAPSVIMELTNEQWTVFPNPISDEINIISEKYTGELSIRLFDVSGKVVHSDEINFQEKALLEHLDLTSGVYFLELITREGEVVVFKMVK